MLSELGLASFSLWEESETLQEFQMANPQQIAQAMTVRATRYPEIISGHQGVPVRDGRQGCPGPGSVSIAWGS